MEYWEEERVREVIERGVCVCNLSFERGGGKEGRGGVGGQ